MNYYHEGKLIGTLTEGIYRKKVKGSKHTLKILNAWGIEKEVIDKIDCTEIRIKDIETDTVYSLPFQSFKEHAIEKNFGSPQLFVPKKYWNFRDAKQAMLI